MAKPPLHSTISCQMAMFHRRILRQMMGLEPTWVSNPTRPSRRSRIRLAALCEYRDSKNSVQDSKTHDNSTISIFGREKEKHKLSGSKLRRILTFHRVNPDYIRFLAHSVPPSPSSNEDEEFELQQQTWHIGFSYLTNHADPEDGDIMPELKRSGRRYEMNLNLKLASRDESKEWRISGTTIHHHFDVGSGSQLWITSGPQSDSIRKRIAELYSVDRNNSGSFVNGGNISPSFRSSLELHVFFATWAMENWRQYLRSLQNQLTAAEASQPTRNSNVGSSFGHRKGASKVDTCALDVMSMAEQASEVLAGNVDVLTSLRDFYVALIDNDNFPLAERQICKPYEQKFIEHTSNIIKDASVQSQNADRMFKYAARQRQNVSEKPIDNGGISKVHQVDSHKVF
ncbi:hypothetical protein B0J13DRAFT_201415 [Dactylonectria estremocensis]|uniref:CorA-like transporter domain-containing protein n=1 Tax=Dactylonectria estremocensis TaxID=1079267 RepID=A0A9P9DF53_9HYPO|nr:hypothetical protein B0J13DRAFT_201415 [Dactylonectria estremocensis]